MPDRKTERDDVKAIDEFADEVNDHALIVCCLDYAAAVGALPVEAQAFQRWYSAKYPEALTSHLSREAY